MEEIHKPELRTVADQLGQRHSEGLRRLEDHERLTKLEYIVADHHIAIRGMEAEIKTISEANLQIINNLKTIKHTLIGGLVGGLIMTGSYEQILDIAGALIGLP